MSKSPDISYAGSPVQNQMTNMMMPGFQQMYGGVGSPGQNLSLWNTPSYNIPQTPTVGVQPTWEYNVPGYNTTNYQVPGISSMMPNTGWFNNLDPSIQQGLMEPTNVAAREMLNTMGGQGLMNARGGYSGESQTALADLYSKGAQQAGLNAWNMISPIQQNQWQAQLGQSQYGAGMQNQASRDIWGAQTGMAENLWKAQMGAQQNAWNQQQTNNMANWQAQLGLGQYNAQNQLAQNQMPWNLMSSLFGASLPSPVVSPGTGQSFMNNFLSPLITGAGMYGISKLFPGT